MIRDNSTMKDKVHHIKKYKNTIVTEVKVSKEIN